MSDKIATKIDGKAVTIIGEDGHIIVFSVEETTTSTTIILAHNEGIECSSEGAARLQTQELVIDRLSFPNLLAWKMMSIGYLLSV